MGNRGILIPFSFFSMRRQGALLVSAPCAYPGLDKSNINQFPLSTLLYNTLQLPYSYHTIQDLSSLFTNCYNWFVCLVSQCSLTNTQA